MKLRDAQGADAAAMTKVFLDARCEAMPWLPELYAERDVLNWMAQVVIAQTQVILGVSILRVSPEGVVGFASLRPGELDHLYVAPGRQGRGRFMSVTGSHARNARRIAERGERTRRSLRMAAITASPHSPRSRSGLGKAHDL